MGYFRVLHLVWGRVVVRHDLLERHQHRHCPRCCASNLPAGILAPQSQNRRMDIPLTTRNATKERERRYDGKALAGQWHEN